MLTYGQHFEEDKATEPFLGDYALVDDFQSIAFDHEKSKISFLFVKDKTYGTIEGLDFDIHFNPRLKKCIC